MKKTSSYLKRLFMGLIVGAFAMAGGCSLGVLDPGSTPSRISINVKAAVTPLQVQRAIDIYVGPPSTHPGSSNLSDPMWDWGLYYLKQDGTIWDVPALKSGSTSDGDWASRREFRYLKGEELMGQAVFVAPPGKRTYRLLLEAYLEYQTYDELGSTIRPVPIATFSEDLILDLKPNDQLNINRNFGAK